MNQPRPLVYGEHVEDLLPGLVRFREGLHRTPDGSYVVWATLSNGDAAPLRRALLRAEAELMKEDGGAIGTSAAALVRIVSAISAGTPRN